jgi:hypothetical protein
MRKPRRFNAPRFMGLPSILLAVAWVMLWLLWPGQPRAQPRRSQLRDTRVAYLRLDSGDYSLDNDPTRFLLRSAVGFGPNDGEKEEGIPDMVPAGHVVEPEFLEWRSVAEIPPTVSAGIFESPASRAPGSYRPHRGERTVFAFDGEAGMRVFIRVSPELKKYELQVPEIPVYEEKGLVEKPWFVTVSLEMDEEGKPTNVFLENPSEDKEINAAMVRLMYDARLLKPGKECVGTVSVGYLKH